MRRLCLLLAVGLLLSGCSLGRRTSTVTRPVEIAPARDVRATTMLNPARPVGVQTAIVAS